jgi:hypothetical protein
MGVGRVRWGACAHMRALGRVRESARTVSRLQIQGFVERILAFVVVLTAWGVANAAPVAAVTVEALAGRGLARRGVDLRLRDGSGMPTGADLSGSAALGRAPRASSYFQERSDRVEHSFHHFMHGNALEDMRARDQIRLYGPALGGVGAAANGVAIFSSAVIGAAHAPRPLRVLFDRQFHLGPAIFDQGGMGAGFGGAL